MDIYKRKSKKYLSIILTLALVITSISMPGVTKTVYATGGEAKVPTTGTYLAKADFMDSKNFNKNFGLATDSQIAKKVYFGTSDTDLEWWMAGVEDVTGSNISATTLVLFSNQALMGIVKYNDVALANYKESKIHKETLPKLYEDRFSPSEQEAIVPVTLGYKGYKNSNANRESMTVTNCKLYLPDADNTGQNVMLKVGQSNFEVKKNYWCSGAFWLRSANYNYYYFALVAYSGQVYNNFVIYFNSASPAPACNVNLTSVIFSSAAPAASSTDADLTSGTTMTLRFASDKTVTGSDCTDRIKSSAEIYPSGVKVTSPTSGEYLYVQWNDGNCDKVKSFDLGLGKTDYLSSEIFGDDNTKLNNNCKIWIETKEDNLVYAKEFTGLKQDTAASCTFTSILTPGLKYNGEKHELITTTDVVVTGGNIVYGISTGSNVTPTEWNEEVPKAVNSGDYYVWYYVKANKAGYKDNTAQCVGKCNIGKGNILTVTSSSLKVAEGETVKITVAAAGTSYAGIKAVLKYNKNLFAFVTVTDLAGATGNIEVSGSDITYNKIANSTNNNEDNGLVAIGDLFEVIFKAKENVTVNSSGAFEISGEYTVSRDDVAADAEKITEKSISVGILKVFKDANKPVAASPTTVLFDGKNKALYTTPSEIVTNSTIIYSYTKDNKTVTSTTIPQVTEIGTYTDVKYTISANGYKTFDSEPTTFTIKGPEYEVELIDNYVAGKALILVFTNADLDKQNVNVKYDAKKMYKLENSGYAVSPTNTTYTNVYGIIEKNSSEIKLTRDGVKNKINFAGGSTNTSIDCGNYDVNGTNKVDISDAVAAMGVYNVYYTYFEGKDVWNKIILKSDVNHDKVVDTGDVIKILLAN